MISDKHRFIFIHIPKCGGTYITHHLLPFSEDYVRAEVPGPSSDSIMVRRPDERMHDHFDRGYMHASANDLMLYMGREKYDQYLSFASVRNPYERLISVYFWGAGRGRDFVDKKHFLTDIHPPYNPHDRSTGWRYNARLDDYFPHSCTPMEYFLLDEKGEMLVDFLFKIDTMATSLTAVCQTVNIPLTLSTRKYNASQHDHYSLYYDDEMREHIAHTYKWEIDFFGFEFEDKRGEG